MRLSSLLGLAGLCAVAWLGMILTEPPRRAEPEPEPVETAETESGPLAPIDMTEEVGPTEGCGRAIESGAVLAGADALVFKAGPETLVVEPDDLVAVAPFENAAENWGVTIELCPEATRAMAQFTHRRAGERLEIISGGARLSAPIIRQPVLDGRLTLTGGFDRARAEEIAARIAGRTS